MRGGDPRPPQPGAPKRPSPPRLDRDRNWGERRPARDRKRKRGALPWKEPAGLAAWGVLSSSRGTGFTWYVWPQRNGPDSVRGGQSGGSGRRPGRGEGRGHSRSRALASSRPPVCNRSPVSSLGCCLRSVPGCGSSRLRAPLPPPLRGDFHLPPLPERTFSNVWRHCLGCTNGGVGRPGMLLSIPQCTEQPPTTKRYQ